MDDYVFKPAATRRATIKDVARRAGVSPATVSRCINNPGAVRVPLRERVDRAIAALAYVPHGAARALVSRRSRMMGAVFPSLDNSLFGGVLDALQAEIAAAGYSLVVASSNYDPQQEREHVRNLVSSGVDAMMLVGGLREPEVYGLLDDKGVPHVAIWIADESGPVPCIGFDNAKAAAVVTRHLLDLGHRRIAVISGILEGNDRAATRVHGVHEALAARSLELPAEWLVERPFGVEQGREAFRLLMARRQRPTAVICGADPFAYGVLFESERLGISVPGEVSVTGFDDMWLAAHLTPSLTTVRTPRREMGQLAGRYLLSRLAGRELGVPRPLDVELVLRESTAPPLREV